MKIDMRATILVTFLAMAGLALSLVVHLGGFKSVEISEVDAGPWKTVYKQNLGAYYKVAPLIDEIETYVRAHGDACKFTFGQFLDDMDHVPEDRLHANAGCIVEHTVAPLPPDAIAGSLPAGHFVIAEFAGAPSIGPMKVYPKVRNYFAAHRLASGGPVIEMYQVMDDKSVITKYYFPVQAAALPARDATTAGSDRRAGASAANATTDGAGARVEEKNK